MSAQTAPTVGSQVASFAGGQTFPDIRTQAYRELADGSFTATSASSAIWNYKNLTASGTTVVKTGAGQLYGFYVGTATGNITIYDNTAGSGTVVLATSAVPTAGTTYVIPISFGTGLTIVLSGGAVVTALYL